MPRKPLNETQEQRAARLKRTREAELRRKAKDPEAFNKKRCEYVKKYRLANPEKVDAATRKWQSKNKDHINQKRRVYRSKNQLQFLLYEAKLRAKKRGIEFSITADDVPPMGECCPLLGHPFSPSEAGRTPLSPSLDRIDSSRGYVKGNVWVVGARANCIKNDATAEEHEKIARAMRDKNA